MDLYKRGVNGKYGSEFYCKKNEIIDQQNCVLLGFKDNLPVLSNTMPPASRNSVEISPKKTVKVEVDAQTGEKFLNLNGRKLKMVTESELPLHLKRNHLIKPNPGNGILVNKPVKIKIIRNMSSILHDPAQLMKTSETQDIDKPVLKPNVNKTDSDVDDSKLSHKTMLIKAGTFPTVIASVGKVFTACSAPASNGIDVKKDNGIIKNLSQFQVNLGKIQNSEIKTYQRPCNMKALDLSKLTKEETYSNSDVGGKTFEDKCVQTDEKILVSEFSQTEVCQNSDPVVQEQAPSASPFNSTLFDMDFNDLVTYLNGPPTPTSNLPVINTIVKEVDMPFKPMNSQPTGKIGLFFNDLRAALVPDEKGNMPIHIGVLANDLNLVKRNCTVLKALQKSVDVPNHGDLTALQLAVINDSSPEILTTLLVNGASLDVTDIEGNNIIHLASILKREEILEIIFKSLIHDKFDLDQFNAEGFTPLMICCINKYFHCAELLLANGADYNMRDRKSGRTPLFHAAENHDVEMVNLLLSYNADTKIKNFFGTSPHDAMYEVEEIPVKIKTMILRKNSKRKIVEDPKSPKIKRKECAKKPLKTYARFKKIEYDFLTKTSTVDTK